MASNFFDIIENEKDTIVSRFLSRCEYTPTWLSISNTRQSYLMDHFIRRNGKHIIHDCILWNGSRTIRSVQESKSNTTKTYHNGMFKYKSTKNERNYQISAKKVAYYIYYKKLPPSIIKLKCNKELCINPLHFKDSNNDIDKDTNKRKFPFENTKYSNNKKKRKRNNTTVLNEY
jgi:hypothetical protein